MNYTHTLTLLAVLAATGCTRTVHLEPDDPPDPATPAPATPPGEEETLEVELVVANQSSYEVWDLFVAPCGSETWGNDILGDTPIYPGSGINITGAPPGCYDFLALTAEGGFWDWYGVDVQTAFTWTLND